jgi:hypothetical protein
MTKILVTDGVKIWGNYLYDVEPSFEVIELIFPNARRITRSNSGWSVEVKAVES